MADGGGIRVGVLTVSDRCSRGKAEDRSGPNLTRLVLEEPRLSIKEVAHECVPDDIEEIKKVLLRWSDEDHLNLILTTGGTGFSPRDVTPEATSQVIDRLAPGLAHRMMEESLKVTPLAMLSRPVCGTRKRTLIINFPGSVKGSQECFHFISRALPHAIELLMDSPKVSDTHKAMGAHHQQLQQDNHDCSRRFNKDLTRIAERDRHSPFPMVPMDEAINIVMKQTEHLGTDTVNVEDGMGYILANDVLADSPFPPFPASIKDGYAVVASDGPGVRKVLGPVTAGVVTSSIVTSGHVMRITTGAPVPSGADSVVQVEDTELVESADEGQTEVQVNILSTPNPDQDIRAIGFDIAAGELVLSKGSPLGPPELGLLATVGVTKVPVYRKPRVAIMSTGNELVGSGEIPQAGQIRDSNKIMLSAAVTREGFEVLDLGIALDSPDDLQAKLKRGVSEADVIISSGGVSMGEKDLLKPVLEKGLGATVHFGRVFMKPGKPTTFASLRTGSQKKLLFALPGNPVSAMVTFYLFVLPALRKLAGHQFPHLTKIKAKLAKSVRLDPRPEYHRAVLSWQPDDPIPVAQSTGSQCSSRLLSMRTANALLVLPPRSDELIEIGSGSIVDALILGPV
ncbi:gephyrin isoform X2 [Nematostella vectensis]|uniref:gephyrin isoform X2 n=1 Tax=Nematostella vectensis TaxID=45351 RepID=UPI0013903656|nr:gephyrin isoform X2 [Nematostella vectensis]